MKKKSIEKLRLKKAAISALNSNHLYGGDENTTQGTVFCQSVNVCETIDYTRCYGELQCQFYDTNGR